MSGIRIFCGDESFGYFSSMGYLRMHFQNPDYSVEWQGDR
jgi:hypothetical protein